MLDENEFLSPYGIRAVPLHSASERNRISSRLRARRIAYRSIRRQLLARTDRFPVNFLLIESLQKFHHYLGHEFTVECPTSFGEMMTLWEVAAKLLRRRDANFPEGTDGWRPVH